MDPSKDRDHTLPLSPDEIQRIKTVCGIFDQGAGTSCPNDGARSNGANAEKV